MDPAELGLLLRTVGRRYDDTRVEEITRALASRCLHLVVTGFVYATFRDSHRVSAAYLDALYFTVATLTTTGFGDITCPATGAGAVDRGHADRHHPVPASGPDNLQAAQDQAFLPDLRPAEHDPDAVHCKACGVVLCIPDDGA